MPRIAKDEHPRILRMVDEEHRKVAEVAARYGCTPANIYALLSKLRREIPSGTGAVSVHETSPDITSPAVLQQTLLPDAAAIANLKNAPDLFAPTLPADNPPGLRAKGGRRRSRTFVDPATGALLETASKEGKPTISAVSQLQPEAFPSPSTSSAVTQPPGSGAATKRGGVGATLAKPGMALMMRTADGEENLTPFRSLDDLLSAVKPILRAAARSPDAVWFSIQSVDLSLLDGDGA